jgi:hypothetical protein
VQSKEEMNAMITTRIEEMWETLDRKQFTHFNFFGSV